MVEYAGVSVAALGWTTVAVFLGAVMSGRVSVLAASIVVPTAMAVVGGAGPQLGDLMLAGVLRVAPVAIMMLFAMLYFGLMLEVGLFRPLVRGLVASVGGDPLRLCLVTAILPMLVALDGDGATTFLISVTALLPVHRRLRLRPVVLPGIIGLAAGVMNLLPWGGPTARVMTVLRTDASQVFHPLLPAMIAGLAWVLVAAGLIGWRERVRLARLPPDPPVHDHAPDDEAPPAQGLRTAANLALTVALLVALFSGAWPLPVLFMGAFAVAVLVNARALESRSASADALARSIVTVTSMILAQGIFTGILTGTGMIDAMASGVVQVAPARVTAALSTLVAITSMPLSLVFTPDAYYFGVLPVLARTAEAAGHDPLAIGRAALLGQMTTGFPLSPLTASTFVLIGLSGVGLAEHQRFLFGWAFGSTAVMTIVARLAGVI